MQTDAQPETPRLKKQLNIALKENVYERFKKVARSSHMKPTEFAALIVSTFSELEEGHALKALTSIPPNMFRGKPGRKVD